MGAAAASASAAGDPWGDPAVTLLESPEDSLADPIVLLHSPEDSLGDPVGRYSAAVLTRRFIGRPDPVVTMLQLRPKDSLGDPIRSLSCYSSRPRIHWATQAVVTLLQLSGESLGDPVVALDSRPEILWGTHHVSVFICE